jgi:UDP-N-acetylmuramyl pentapeptide phosphotransferase/UDP-N-acetylglucosamine-1-phosphate transferase
MARKKELVVKPNKRTSHEGRIPNIGGINIYSSFVLSYLIFSTEAIDFQYRVVLAGMFFILLVGFFDDMIELLALRKLWGEVIAGFLLIVVADIRLTNLYGFIGIGEIAGWLSYPLSFFVYLLVINGLNLIDGVDGLASGLGVVICTFFGVYFDLINESSLSMMSFALVGALLIFFFYNVFGGKFKIFMGDSGALVLGYIVYLLVVRFCEINAYSANIINSEFAMSAAPVVAICVLSIPLIDTLRVMVTRIKKGLSPFAADRNHVHHLLLNAGLKHREVTLVLILVNLFFIVIGLLLRNVRIELAFFIVVACAFIFTISLWRTVDRFEQKKAEKNSACR